MIYLWEFIGNQWIMSFGGPVALDMSAIKVVMDTLDIPLDEALLRKIKAIESVMLEYYASKSK